jgi:AcrR family transcriptional regulator
MNLSGGLYDPLMETATPGRRYGGLTPEERLAERRARLIETGLELFGTRGYANTTLEALCSAAAMSPRHFYEQFADREALFVALYDELVERSMELVGPAVADADGGLAEMLDAAVDALLGFYADRRIARVVLAEVQGISPAVEQRRRRAIERFAELGGELIAGQGVLGKRDAKLLAIAVNSGITELLTFHLADPEAVTAADVKAAANRLVTGAVADTA